MKQIRNMEQEICQRKIDRMQFRGMMAMIIGTILGALAGFLIR